MKVGCADNVTPSYRLVEAAFPFLGPPKNDRCGGWGGRSVTGSQNTAEEKGRKNKMRKKKQRRSNGI